MQKRKVLLIGIGLAITLTGCTGSLSIWDDRFSMQGTPEGWRAGGDALTGMQVVSKTDQANLPANPYHALRQAQEMNATERLRFRFMKNAAVEERQQAYK